MIQEREDLTAIPHPKCACGHTDDMHFADRGELKRWDLQHKGGSERRPRDDKGWGCKMLVTRRDEKGWLEGAFPCDCRKWQG